MRRLIQIPLLILGMLLLGALGFHLLTDMPLIDSMYHAVILLTTVGYETPQQPMSNPVKIFIMIYLAGGLGVFTYSLFQFGQILVNSNLQNFLEQRRMDSEIDHLSNHFIICGFGRMGQPCASTSLLVDSRS